MVIFAVLQTIINIRTFRHLGHKSEILFKQKTAVSFSNGPVGNERKLPVRQLSDLTGTFHTILLFICAVMDIL